MHHSIRQARLVITNMMLPHARDDGATPPLSVLTPSQQRRRCCTIARTLLNVCYCSLELSAVSWYVPGLENLRERCDG